MDQSQFKKALFIDVKEYIPKIKEYILSNLRPSTLAQPGKDFVNQISFFINGSLNLEAEHIALVRLHDELKKSFDVVTSHYGKQKITIQDQTSEIDALKKQLMDIDAILDLAHAMMEKEFSPSHAMNFKSMICRATETFETDFVPFQPIGTVQTKKEKPPH